jgi:hypothetical protein
VTSTKVGSGVAVGELLGDGVAGGIFIRVGVVRACVSVGAIWVVCIGTQAPAKRAIIAKITEALVESRSSIFLSLPLA